MGTINNNINIEAELQEKLKASNLSEKEIKEIVPEILKLTNRIKEDVENSQTETTTKNFLLDLRQDVTNNSNVSIDIKRNKGTVIGTIELNNVTNNFYVINKSHIKAHSETISSTGQKAQPETISSTGQKVQSETISSVQLDQTNITLDNYEGYDKALSQLIYEIEGCASSAKYKRGLNKSGKETLKTAKAKLKQYKDIISDKKRMLEHELKAKNKLNAKNPDKAPLTVSISAAEINELKNRWFYWRQKIEFDIKEGQMGKSSNTAPRPNQSLEQVNKGNNVDHHHVEYDSRLNAALNDAAFLRIIDNNQDRAREFLQAIANNSLSDAQITICQSRMVQLAPYFEQYGLTNQVHRCIQTRGGRIEMVQGNSKTSVDYGNMDRGETFQQGGIAGVIDKALSNCKNMTPGQRNTWKSLGVLGGFAVGVYGLYKFFTNKKMSFWGKAGLTAATIFGSQALTGEGPLSLFNKLMTGGFSKEYLEDKFGNAFGDAVNGLGNSGIEASNTLAPAMYSMMIFNPNTTVGNVNTMTQSFKTDPNSRKDFRFQAIDKLKNKYGTKSSEYFSATFPNNFDEEKRNNRLASFGVTEITDTSKANVSIYELANNASMNEIIIEKFRTEHGVKETSNDVKKKEFEEYVSNLKKTNKAIDIKDLENHPEWFELDKNATYTERVVDNQFKDTLVSQTESRGINEPKKSELKSAIRRFYDERTIDSKPILSDFSLKLDNGILILKSHNGQETKIDINKNEIVGFGNGIRFSDLSELLNVADITNKILESQKGKIATGNPPFQYKSYMPNITNGIGLGGRGIYFNDETFSSSINFDTRVLSGGWGGIMGKIDTIGNYPEDYAKYLSDRWMKINNPALTQ